MPVAGKDLIEEADIPADLESQFLVGGRRENHRSTEGFLLAQVAEKLITIRQ